MSYCRVRHLSPGSTLRRNPAPRRPHRSTSAVRSVRAQLIEGDFVDEAVTVSSEYEDCHFSGVAEIWPHGYRQECAGGRIAALVSPPTPTERQEHPRWAAATSSQPVGVAAHVVCVISAHRDTRPAHLARPRRRSPQGRPHLWALSCSPSQFPSQFAQVRTVVRSVCSAVDRGP